jgi:hypothetical protein
MIRTLRLAVAGLVVGGCLGILLLLRWALGVAEEWEPQDN